MKKHGLSKKTMHRFYRWWRRQVNFEFEIPLRFRQDDLWLDAACKDVRFDMLYQFRRWLEAAGSRAGR